MHDLVHLREAHHSTDFWRHVERVMPGFEARALWLAEKGGAYVGL